MNRQFKLGVWGLGLIVLLAVVGPLVLGRSPHEFSLAESLHSPSLFFPMGFDEDGRDLLTLVLYGARVSLTIGLTTILITASLGTLIGALAGFFGGRLDELFIFVTDVLLAFPSILLVIALAAFQTTSSVAQVILILCVVGWVSFARLVRGQVLALREREYIKAAQLCGVRFPRLLVKHLVPNLAGPLLVQASFALAGVIIAESTLSFLGLGVPPSVPSWGRLLDQGVQYLLVAPHLSIFPGVAIMLTIIFLHFIGDGLRDRLDRRSELGSFTFEAESR